jgi:hypothetical protein
MFKSGKNMPVYINLMEEGILNLMGTIQIFYKDIPVDFFSIFSC